MQTITKDTLREIADAFGLGWEVRSNLKVEDPFGSYIVPTAGKRGFLTRVSGPDFARRRGSKVVDSDGHVVFEHPERWRVVRPAIDPHPKRKTNTYFKQEFEIASASYVATEVCGTPERVFLFTNALDFDLSYIIARLYIHRRKNPPNIFPDGQRKFYPHKE